MRGRMERIAGLLVYEAIMRGPNVLARNKRMTGDADVDEIITPVLTEDGFVPLEKVENEQQRKNLDEL